MGLKEKAIILIGGGGELGLNTIKWVKELDLKIIITDIDRNAPGVKYADEFINFSGDDIPNLLNHTIKLNEKYEIVGTHCSNDFGILTQCIISHALDLPQNTLISIINSLDKSLMKKCWASSEIPSPHFRIISNVDALESVATEFIYPVIIKPTDSCGSQGISIVHDKNDLKKKYADAMEYSNNKTIIVEEYLNGTMHDANGLLYKGHFYPCGIMDRFFGPSDIYPFIKKEVCLSIGERDPTKLDRETQMKIYTILENAAKSLGITFGPVKGDFVKTDNGVFILEITPRFHGDIQTSFTTTLSSGINPIKLYLKLLKSGEVDLKYIEPTNDKIASWRAIFPESCDLELLKYRIDATKKVDGVEKIIVNNINDKNLKNREYSNNSHIPLFLIISANSDDELDNIFHRVRETIG